MTKLRHVIQKAGLAKGSYRTPTWGKTVLIRPGYWVDAGDFALSPDVRQQKRPVDVRALTDEVSIPSRDCTAYIKATCLYADPTAELDKRGAHRMLFGRLSTGSGGITIQEEFLIPATGKSIHVGADSCRVEVWIDPKRGGFAEDGSDVEACAGFEVHAQVTTARLFLDEVRAERVTTNEVLIPTFTRDMQFLHETPQNIIITFEDVFGNTVWVGPPTPWVGQFAPLPIEAYTFQIAFLTAAGPTSMVTNTPILNFKRYS